MDTIQQRDATFQFHNASITIDGSVEYVSDALCTPSQDAVLRGGPVASSFALPPRPARARDGRDARSKTL